MPRTEMRVETLEYGPRALLERRGLREQMVDVLMGLDVLLDPATSLDEEFWGLLRSEVGRRGMSCDTLPGARGAEPAMVGTIIVLHGAKLGPVMDSARDALGHWTRRGHSRELTIELSIVVDREGGMERAEVRGPIGAVVDALRIGSDGFSEVGR